MRALTARVRELESALARVKQLQREPLKVQPDIEGGNYKDFEKLQSDPDVVAFYGGKP